MQSSKTETVTADSLDDRLDVEDTDESAMVVEFEVVDQVVATVLESIPYEPTWR
jgi:hypothetical protein